MDTKLANISPEKLRLLAKKLNEKKGAGPGGAIRRKDPEATRFPLSFGQERLWLIQQLMPEMPSYNAPFVFRLHLPPRCDIWERVMAELIRRHEVLRTTIQVVDGIPMQMVAPSAPVHIPFHDLRDMPREERESAALEIVRRDICRKFDLAQGPLWRLGVICLDDEDTINYSTIHHSICDGLSRSVLMREITGLAMPLFTGLPMPQLPPLPVQYGDYALWQREQLQDSGFESSLKYWTSQLQDFTELELPTDHPRPPVARFGSGSFGMTIPQPVVERLKQLSRNSRATLFMTMLAAFQVVLKRYTGQHDLAVGTPVSTRNRIELEPLLGYFVNTLVLRADLGGDPTFREVLERVRNVCVGAYANQELPFERLVQQFNQRRDLSRNPLFQVAFQLEEAAAAAGPAPAAPGGIAEYLNFDHFGMTVTNLDLDVHLFGEWGDGVVRRSEGMRGVLTYDPDLFEPATIERLAGHYNIILDAVSSAPDTRLSDLPMLSLAERDRLTSWNATRRHYPAESLIAMFEQQAHRSPDAEAVVFEDRSIAYEELNCRANQLAHRLRALGVGPEVLVGVCAERSIEMVVFLLGVLKAGGAYVPIPPSEPEARRDYMISSAGIRVLVAQQWLETALAGTAGHLVFVSPDFSEIAGESRSDPGVPLEMSNLAYTIWTSGSTGKPKAAMNTHGSLANILNWMQENYRLNPGDRVLQKTAFHFDVSIFEFFCPLIAGAALVVARPGGHRDPRYLGSLIKAARIGTVHFVPSMLDAALEAGALDDCPELKDVICIGEPVTPALCRNFFRRSSARLHNMYGPAETAVAVTWWQCEDAEVRTVSIGGPVANTQIHLLDDDLQPVPVGVPGEIYIGGANVGRGYFGQPGMTAVRYLPDPFNAEPGARLYRTGDRARRLTGGGIEFLGRRDYQVKVRGNRVELGEIEAVLAEHPAIQTAVVTAWDDPARGCTLAAYCLPVSLCTPSALREFLKLRLPDYMVPQDIVLVDSLPRTGSGKVDRRALPHPGAATEGGQCVRPRDSLELDILNIWEDLLGRKDIGVTDDFFLSGGHSILAVRLLARCHAAFGRDLPLAAFYQNPSVEQMAIALRSGTESRNGDPLVVLRRGNGDRPPLFLFHAAGGSSITYYELARALPAEWPVYGLEDTLGTDPCLESMARRYVEAMRRVQPAGPYYLGGWSTGATVAFEAARQIRESGGSIGLLALFDGFSPYQPSLDGSDPNAASARVLATIARNLSIYFGQTLPVSEADLATQGYENQIAAFLESAKGRNVFPPDFSIEQVRAFLEWSVRHVRAFWAYRPPLLAERLILFRSCEPLSWTIAEESEAAVLPDYGWQRLSSVPVTICPVPGNHVSMFQPPQVRLLAEALVRVMEPEPEPEAAMAGAASGTTR